MPFETIAYLAFVASALTLFAATLAYAEWATRHANDGVHKPAQFRQEKPARPNAPDALRKAA